MIITLNNPESMKTNAIVASTIVALLITGAAVVTLAHASVGLGAGSSTGQSTTSHSTFHEQTNTNHTGEHDNETEGQNQNNQGESDQDEGGHFNLTVGSTLTFSNLTGHWVAFSHIGNHSDGEGDAEDNFTTQVGNSTGAFTFKVTSASGGDFNLTITSGHFTINGTTYTVSGGNIRLNEGDESGFGTGTASGGATFEIHIAGIHGNITSTAQVGAIKLDVKIGSSDYLVILGSHEGVAEDNESD